LLPVLELPVKELLLLNPLKHVDFGQSPAELCVLQMRQKRQAVRESFINAPKQT
jgi:hypothetical protein